MRRELCLCRDDVWLLPGLGIRVALIGGVRSAAHSEEQALGGF